MNTENKRCLNCDNIVEDVYCGKCGQSINTTRISFRHIFEELEYGIFHINKGLLYTTKQLFIRPGKTVKEYISGKRMSYSKPFIYLIVIGTIYSIIFHFFHYFPMEEMNRHDTEIFEYIPIYRWYSSNYSLVLLFLMPFYAFATYLLFRKKGYNYIEYLVLFSYINGAKIVLMLLFYPIIYFSKSNEVYHVVITLVEIYLIWGITQFLHSNSWIKTTLKVILSQILALLVLLILVFLIFQVFKHFHIKI